jgi:anthranilate phosphoribosyltransferase
LDGLDEITLSGETLVMEVTGNKMQKMRLVPEDFKLQRTEISHLKALSADESARIILEVLNSKRRDEARALVVINAAAALFIGGLAKNMVQAARLAEQSIDSGQAHNKLERLIQSTNRK